MRAFRLAWLSLVRRPGRALLGILGVAAVGALLFDMLLLSRGLVVSFRTLLDSAGYDVRVLGSEGLPFTAQPVPDATRTAAAAAALPEVESAVALRFIPVEGESAEGRRRRIDFIAVDPSARRLWTIVRGSDAAPADSGAAPSIIINRAAAATLRVEPGATLRLRGSCAQGGALLPPVDVRVAGVGDFPFDDAVQMTASGDAEMTHRLCGADASEDADLLLVESATGAGADAAAAAIRRMRPDLYVVTNEDVVDRFRRVEFSYFRQISVVLSTVTLFFGFLLIAVLLTVSVNQRLGEIAALRALGLSRTRVVAGVLWESALLVGAGGVIALPLGAALSVWLDRILRAMPGIPASVHFFVFEPRAIVLHATLLAVTAVAAAAYPMFLTARLAIAATLRQEVVS